MKTLQKIVAILLLINSPLCCQKKLATTTPILFIPQGFVMAPLSGYGYSNCIENAVANLSCVNPAFISSLDRFSVGFSYHLESKLKDSWIADIHHYRLVNYFPQSAAMILPLKHFHIGAGFQQYFSSKLDYGQMAGVVVDTTSETGYRDDAIIHPVSKTLLTKNSLSLSKSFKHNRNLLHLGVQLNYYLLSYKQELRRSDEISDTDANDFDFRLSSSKWGFGAGIIYEMSNLKLGVFYDRGVKFKEPVQAGDYEIEVAGEALNRLSIGFQSYASERVKIISDVNYLFRSKADGEKNRTAQFDFAVNLNIRLNRYAQETCGFYNTNYDHDSDGIFDNMNSKLRATFLMLGGILTIKQLQLDCCVADSHWLSGEWRKQTIVKIGFGTML